MFIEIGCTSGFAGIEKNFGGSVRVAGKYTLTMSAPNPQNPQDWGVQLMPPRDKIGGGGGNGEKEEICL